MAVSRKKSTGLKLIWRTLKFAHRHFIFDISSGDPNFLYYSTNYPRLFRLHKRLALLHNKWIDFTWSTTQAYRNFENWLFSGPVKIQLPELNCRDWHDADTYIIYANFQILVDFIEKELPWQHPDRDKLKTGRRYPEVAEDFVANHGDYSHVELWFLYEWWTKTYLVRQNSIGVSKELSKVITGSEDQHDHYELGARQDAWRTDEEDEMLIRLIRIRSKMWT